MAMPENPQFPEVNLDQLLGPSANEGTFLAPYRHASISKINTNTQSKRRRLSERICDSDELIRKVKQLQSHNQQLTDTQRTAKEVTDLYTTEKQQRIELEKHCQELEGRCSQLEIKLDAQVTNCENLEEDLKVRALPMAAKDLVEAYMQLAHRVGDDAGLSRREQNIMKKVRDYCKSAKIVVAELKSPNPKAKRKGITQTMKTQSTQTSTKPKTSMCSVGVQITNLVETRNQGTQHKKSTTTRGTTTAAFIKYRDVGTCFPEPKPAPNVRQILDEMLSWHRPAVAMPLSPIMEPPLVVEDIISKKSTVNIGTCTMLCNVHREIDFMPVVPSQIKVSTSRPPSRTMFESVKDEALAGGTVPSGNAKEFREILNFLPQNQSCLANLPPQAFDELWHVIGQMVLCLLHRGSNPPLSPPPSIKQMDFTSWLYALYEGTLTHPVIEKQRKPDHASSTSSKKDNYESGTDCMGMDVGTDPMDIIAESSNISIGGELTPIHLPPKPLQERKKKSRKRKASSILKPIPKRKIVHDEAAVEQALPQMANELMEMHQKVESPAPETAIQFISNLNTFNMPYCDNLDFDLDLEERYLLRLLSTNGHNMRRTVESDKVVEHSERNPLSPPQYELNDNEDRTTNTDSVPAKFNPKVSSDEENSLEEPQSKQKELDGNVEDATTDTDSLPGECNLQVFSDEETSVEQLPPPQKELNANDDILMSNSDILLGECVKDKDMPSFENDREEWEEAKTAADPPKPATPVHANLHLELFGSESESEADASDAQLHWDSLNFGCSNSEGSEILVIDEGSSPISQSPISQSPISQSPISQSPISESPMAQSPLRPSFSQLKRKERASESPHKEVRLTRLRAKQIQMEQNSLKEEQAKDIDQKLEQTPAQENETKAKRNETKDLEHEKTIFYDLESPASPTSTWTDQSDSPPIEIPLELSGCRKGDGEPKAMLLHVMDAPKGKMQSTHRLTETQKDLLCSTIKRYLMDTIQLDSTCRDLLNEVFKITRDVAVIVNVMITAFCQMTYNWMEPKPNDPLDRLLNALRYFEVIRSNQPSFTQSFLCALEKRLFRVTKDRIQLDWAITCVKLYLEVGRLHASHSNPETYENPSRLLLAKILYRYDRDVTQLVYEVLCFHPTVLPHREVREYNNFDPLITVIKHLLMCRNYEVSDPKGCERLLLSKLRFAYHFQPFEPTKEQVLENLVDKLKAGRLDQLSYAFALFCRRSPRLDVVNNVLAQHLLPLASSYCDLSAHTDAYDVRLEGILQCISVVLKPLPLDTDISSFIGLFKRLLVAVPRAAVQQAAVQAILRLQRFGFKHVLDALQNYRPNYQLTPLTRAMLRSFVQRRRVYHIQRRHAQSHAQGAAT
ncbi:little elongation complex subunit 1 [Drosophila persimilis]|uniref:little elongation complex subunit 1 n=1 Tax=Drosophila persimilis TaxID=7234 RepID=UPI000F08F1C5|nr:little elongation complex subunit 1 [Drosophila persimilis]